MKKITTLFLLLISSSIFAANVTLLKTSIAEEGFQMYVVAEILKKAGHNVEITNDVGYDIAYRSIADNAKSDDVHLMVASWDPLHDAKIQGAGGEANLVKIGPYIEGCAQGYLIDKKTADAHNIKYYNDLQNPKIAKLFDSSGDGKADLAGCNAGWGCEKVIEHQLDAYDMRSNVNHKQGEYSAIIADTIARYKSGKPVLYYTWTPYWVSGNLVPGKDVVFLQVKHSAHPITKSTQLANGDDYGFNVNNQNIIANASIKSKNPEVYKLLSQLRLSVNDISGQNMLMAGGANSENMIQKHAQLWLKNNSALINSWIANAK